MVSPGTVYEMDVVSYRAGAITESSAFFSVKSSIIGAIGQLQFDKPLEALVRTEKKVNIVDIFSKYHKIKLGLV